MEEVNDLAKFLLELADAADEGGFTAIADSIAAVLPSVRMMRAAQYEGFQHYWLQNGRAFERAWMLKRRQRPTMEGTPEEERRSAHETWFEVLDEYQKSLEGEHADWLARYARSMPSLTKEAASPFAPPKPKPTSPSLSPADMAQYQAHEQYNRKRKDKKKKEGPNTKQDPWRGVDNKWWTQNKADASAEGSSAEMGPGQKKLHEHIEDKAKQDGETEGEEWSEWLKDSEEAGRHFMRSVMAKVDDGSKPGVAFYEALDDMTSGRELRAIEASIGTAVDYAIKVALAKDVKKAQWMANMWEKLKGMPGAMMGAGADALGFSGPGMQNKINTEHQIAMNNMASIWAAAKTGAPINPVQIQNAVKGLQQAVSVFTAKMKQSGMPSAPAFPDINNYARNVGGKSALTAPDIQRWSVDVDRVLNIVKSPDVARTMRRMNPLKKAPQNMKQKAPQQAIEDQYLSGEINSIVGRLNLGANVSQQISNTVVPLLDQHIKQIVSRGGDEMAVNMALRAISNAVISDIGTATKTALPQGYNNRHQFDAARNMAMNGLMQVLKDVIQRKVQSYTP